MTQHVIQLITRHSSTDKLSCNISAMIYIALTHKNQLCHLLSYVLSLLHWFHHSGYLNLNTNYSRHNTQQYGITHRLGTKQLET